MAAGFITNYGNQENDGLSFATPKRLLNTSGFNPYYLNGTFFETFTQSAPLFGVNGAIIDLDSSKPLPPASFRFVNMQLRNVLASNGEGTFTDSEFNKIETLQGIRHIFPTRCLFYNLGVSGTNPAYSTIGSNSTYVGRGVASTFYFTQDTGISIPHNNIFTNFLGGITLAGGFPSATLASNVKYTLFSKSKFKFILIGGANNETVFTAPVGATDQLKLDNLKTRMATVFGGASDDYLVGCKYTDAPDSTFFIDPARNNYYLVPGSLPTKMSYDGKYIGARPEGSFIAFNSSNFTYSNFDSNGNILDQRVDATATSSIVDLLQIRTINKLDSLGQLAARNGNELNLTETILPNPLIYTNALVLGRTYKVYNGSITVGSTVYNIGDCFIAKGTSFFSGSDTYNPTGITSGTLLVDLGCYEVENNSVTYMGVTYTTGQRFQCYYDSANTFTGTGTVKLFMGGFVRLLSEYYGATGITAGTTLRYMQTYEVVGGTSVSYNSVVYTNGQRFTALSTPATFTAVGGSTLREWNIGYPKSLEMKASKTDSALSTDVWIKMHLTDTPLVNVDGNGKITHGNLDSGFNRATAVPMSVRYWQCRLTIQSLNIPY